MRTPDLGDAGVDVVQDRRDGEAATTVGTVGAQLGQPPVVRACAGHEQLAVDFAADAEPRAERRRRATAHGVGVGEDDLTGDTVGVELLVAVRGVPTAFEPLFVLLVPLLDELVLVATRAHHRRAHLGALHRVVVEGLAILRFEVVAVLRAREARRAYPTRSRDSARSSRLQLLLCGSGPRCGRWYFGAA